MRQIRFYNVGDPSEVLRLEDVEQPSPAAGEALIKVGLCNMIPADMMYISGHYGLKPQLPAGGGFEAVGTIEAVGEGVPLPVGTRVTFTAQGVWQDYVAVPANTLIPVPAQMSDEVACQAFVNPLTAYGMLEVAKVEAGQYLLLTAGNSAFSKFVIQLCKERGIHAIATVRDDAQKQGLLELGAAHVINTKTELLPRAIKEITDKKGVDACFEAVGGETGALALQCLKTHGIMLMYGLLSLQNPDINPGLLIFKDLTLRGFWLSHWLNTKSPAGMQSLIGEVLGKLASNDLQASVDAVYPFEQIKEALAAFNAPGRSGKILLKP